MFSKPSLIADNPLGIVIQSVERPSGDTTVYAYTPAGRLESEVREGQVAHSRYYGYNLDGSRQWVLREDAVNGSHWDVYAYDPVSGRLSSVTDTVPEPDVVHSFVWNPEGTLARWEEPNSYARVFGYDEEGWLVKIERDYGSGGVQVAYEYGYNSDGVRVWKRDVLNQQEYRYVCRIGCGGVPMRVYNRAMSGGSWNTLEEYLEAPTVRWYGTGAESFSDFPLLAGHWLSRLTPPPAATMLYQDWFGVRVGGEVGSQALPNRVPEYLEENPDMPTYYLAANAGNAGDPIECAICLLGCRKKSGWELIACISHCMAGPCAGVIGPKPKPKPTPSPQPSPPGAPGDCPPGTCKFVCPGKNPVTEFGCAPPGTTIECPDGTKIPLPKDCAQQPSPSQNASFETKIMLCGPTGSPCLWVGISLTF
jgi:hypothetical protein